MSPAKDKNPAGKKHPVLSGENLFISVFKPWRYKQFEGTCWYIGKKRLSLERFLINQTGAFHFGIAERRISNTSFFYLKHLRTNDYP